MNGRCANDDWRECRGPSWTGRCPAFQLASQRPALPVVGARRDENLAKLKPIKVNQGEIFSEKEEAQDEMRYCRVDCGDGPSPLRGRWFPDSLCVKPTVGGARMDDDLAKLKPIKVDQGDIFSEKEEAQDEMRYCRIDCGDGPSPR